MGKTAATQGNGVRARGATPSDATTRPGALPPDVRRILIVGAGGFGREVLQWARDAWPDDRCRIVGFLSADPDILEGSACDLGIVATPDTYKPAPGDKLLLAIGVPYARRQVAEALCARGAEFLTLIHPSAIVAESACIGVGSILCPFSIASDSCRIGRFVLLNYNTALGHNAAAGDFSVLSPYATLGGGAHIEEDVFLGLHASVGPGKKVGARSKVSANSCVLANAPSDSIVFGVPGRIGNRIDLEPSPRQRSNT